MKRPRQYITGSFVALLGALVLWMMWPSHGQLDPVAIVPPTANPRDVVRFTATRSFTRLSLDDQLKYLEAWGRLPPDDRSKVIADLMNEPYVLQLSTANSVQTMQLAQSREYFKAPPADRKKLMDQVIDGEIAMLKQNVDVLKKAEAQSTQYKPKVGDQKFRKLLIENTPAEVRVEIGAFVQAKAERLKERGISTDHG